MANRIPTLLAVIKGEGSRVSGNLRPAGTIAGGPSQGTAGPQLPLICKWGTWALPPHGRTGWQRGRRVSPGQDRAALAGERGAARGALAAAAPPGGGEERGLP